MLDQIRVILNGGQVMNLISAKEIAFLMIFLDLMLMVVLKILWAVLHGLKIGRIFLAIAIVAHPKHHTMDPIQGIGL